MTFRVATLDPVAPLTFQSFIASLKARLMVGAGIVLGCFLAGIVYLHLVPDRFTIQMDVIAVEAQQSSTTSSLGASSALFREFTGGDGASRSNIELYLAGLQSIEAARIIAQRPDLMHRIFPSEWNQTDNGWWQPFSLPGVLVRTVKDILGIYVAPWQPPDAVRVQEFLRANIAISRSLTSPVITISMQSADRQFGVDMLYALHDSVDSLLRRRTLARATSYIAYLTSRIPQATIVEYRQALADSIVQQEQLRMSAASNSPFAADLFGRPTPSRLPTSPNGPLVLALSILLGLFLTCLEAVVHDRLGMYRRILKGRTTDLA